MWYFGWLRGRKDEEGIWPLCREGLKNEQIVYLLIRRKKLQKII